MRERYPKRYPAYYPVWDAKWGRTEGRRYMTFWQLQWYRFKKHFADPVLRLLTFIVLFLIIIFLVFLYCGVI